MLDLLPVTAHASPTIVVEHDADVGILTINRADRFNAMDVETARLFRKAGLTLARDERVRCVVVRGVGNVFCSGADLKYIRAHGNNDELGYLRPPGLGEHGGYGRIFKEILEYIHSTISEMKRSGKPWIAAVNGVAAAGGFGIAMACDLVFAADTATFEWAYHKTGLTGAESSTFFLPRLVGLRTAMGLMMLNPRLTAVEAKEHRLINDVFPAATFDADVMAIAHRVARGPTRAFAVAKGLINSAAGVEQLDYQLDRELEELARIADGSDFAEGLSAFFEKRSPRFAGLP
jgi:2-(1,2-epoxy-1,2-dihydrophenyl)acetyl-CoA isomerase